MFFSISFLQARYQQLQQKEEQLEGVLNPSRSQSTDSVASSASSSFASSVASSTVASAAGGAAFGASILRNSGFAGISDQTLDVSDEDPFSMAFATPFDLRGSRDRVREEGGHRQSAQLHIASPFSGRSSNRSTFASDFGLGLGAENPFAAYPEPEPAAPSPSPVPSSARTPSSILAVSTATSARAPASSASASSDTASKPSLVRSMTVTVPAHVPLGKPPQPHDVDDLFASLVQPNAEQAMTTVGADTATAPASTAASAKFRPPLPASPYAGQTSTGESAGAKPGTSAPLRSRSESMGALLTPPAIPPRRPRDSNDLQGIDEERRSGHAHTHGHPHGQGQGQNLEKDFLSASPVPSPFPSPGTSPSVSPSVKVRSFSVKDGASKSEAEVAAEKVVKMDRARLQVWQPGRIRS